MFRSDLHLTTDIVNRKALRLYDVGGKLLNGINSRYVNCLACVLLKGGERECIRIDRGVRQGCIISPWFFMDVVMEEENVGMGRRGESGDYLASCMQMT